jgi:membrane-associated protein
VYCIVHHNYSYFLSYNVIGAILWVTAGAYAGYFFGGMAIIKNNFTLVVLAIVVISILPGVYEVYRSKRQKKLAVSN